MRCVGNRLYNMLDKLEFLDDEFDYKKPFIVGFYNDGRQSSFEFLDDEMVKKVMDGHGYFIFIFDEDVLTLCHSWTDGGIFGSFLVQHHVIGEPGTVISKYDIHECYPELSDFLTGKINAFKVIADSIIEEYSEGGSPMAKHMRDLKFFREYFERHNSLDYNMKKLFDQMGVNNNEFR